MIFLIRNVLGKGFFVIKKKYLCVVFWMCIANVEAFYYKVSPMPGESIEPRDPDTRNAECGTVTLSAIFVDQDDESDSDEFLGSEKENELARQELLKLKRDSALAKFKLNKRSWLNDIASSLQNRFDDSDQANSYPRIDVHLSKMSSCFNVTLAYSAASGSIRLCSVFESDSIENIVARIHRELSRWDGVAFATDRENEMAEISDSLKTSSIPEKRVSRKRPRENS